MNIKNNLKKIFHYKADPIDRWSKGISTIVLYISISVLCAAPVLSCTHAAIQYINDDVGTTGGVGRDISVKEVIETEQLDKDLDVITTEETDEVEIAEETETEVYTESETETETEATSEAIAKGIGYNGIMARIYIWMEGTDADCVNTSAEGVNEDLAFDVTLHMVGIDAGT